MSEDGVSANQFPEKAGPIVCLQVTPIATEPGIEVMFVGPMGQKKPKNGIPIA